MSVPSLVLAPVQLGPTCWDWSHTYVFGVVNVTPDSFSDGGRLGSTTAAVDHALRLVEQGADALDIGGESTRPGSVPVSADQELRRVIPVIEAVARQITAPISVDTYKAKVAREAVAAGASIVNDVSGGTLDPEMMSAVAPTDAAIIVGHLRGKPATMQQNISFLDVVAEVVSELRQRVRAAVNAGMAAHRIWVDPGIGFGKTAEQSLMVLRALERIRAQIGYPVMVGPSRKSFIGEVTGQHVDDRLIGTCAAAAAAVIAGADAVRLHDVAQLQPGIRVADAIRRGPPPTREYGSVHRNVASTTMDETS